MIVDRTEFIAALPKGGIGVEVGVWEGDFSQQALDGCDPATLYLVDPWERNDDVTNYTSTVTRSQEDLTLVYKGVCERFAQYEHVNVTRMRSEDAAKHMTGCNQSADWVYIDAIHTYEAVRQDMALWWPLLKRGGKLTGHDWDKPGVRLAVLEFSIANQLGISGYDGNNWMMTKPTE